MDSFGIYEYLVHTTCARMQIWKVLAVKDQYGLKASNYLTHVANAVALLLELNQLLGRYDRHVDNFCQTDLWVCLVGRREQRYMSTQLLVEKNHHASILTRPPASAIDFLFPRITSQTAWQPEASRGRQRGLETTPQLSETGRGLEPLSSLLPNRYMSLLLPITPSLAQRLLP